MDAHTPAIAQRTIPAGPDQHLDAIRTAGKILVDIGLAVGDHGDTRGAARTGGFGRVEAVKPAPALPVRGAALLALRALAAPAPEEPRIDETEKRPLNRIDRNQRMQRYAAPPVFGANGRGVLDGENVAPGSTRSST